MWKTYSRSPRRFKITVDSIWTAQVDYQWCNEDKLNETLQKLTDKYKNDKHAEIHVFEILDIDWEEDEKLNA